MLMECKTAEELREHLPRLLKGKRHWMFFTDVTEAHVALMSFATTLILLRGISIDDDVKMGNVDFADMKKQFRPVMISFLALPKDKVTAPMVAGFLRRLGRPEDAKVVERDGQDLLLIGDDRSDPVALTAFMASIDTGEFWCGAPENN